MVTNSKIYKEIEQEMLELKKEMFVLRQNGSSKSDSHFESKNKSLKRNSSEINFSKTS